MLTQFTTALVVVLLGLVVGGGLMLTRHEPERVDRELVGRLVETMTAQREDVALPVRGHGTVEARVRSSIVPQVSGRVSAVHDQMAAGGYLPAGEVLVEIEQDDFRLALEQAQTELAQAEAAEETAEAEIAEAQATLADAKRELERTIELVADGGAHRREQERAELAVDVAEAASRRARSALNAARAQVSAARVAMERAETDLRRTRITLPFDAVVIEEQVSVGQFVTSGQAIGRVFGTDAVEIAVPLEDREVGWLAHMPVAAGQRREGVAGGNSIGGSEGGANPQPEVPAEVSGDFFGRWCLWQGRVVRTEGQMDRQSRMVRVVVRVDDPYAGVADGEVPLMPGAFVEVEMAGRELTGVIPVPRYAVHGENEVWVVNDGRLQVRQVMIARRDREKVYVQEGISQGEQVILSPLDAVTDGMLVRVAEGYSDTAEAAANDRPAGEVDRLSPSPGAEEVSDDGRH